MVTLLEVLYDLGFEISLYKKVFVTLKGHFMKPKIQELHL